MAGLRLFNFTHQLLELSLRVRGARHELLSANIANADTPGFQPKDLDFRSVMRSAAELDDRLGESREAQMDSLLSGPLDLRSATHEFPLPGERRSDDRLDGNGVSLDRQIGMMAENSLAYEAALTLLSRTLAHLRYAIGEGRR